MSINPAVLYITDTRHGHSAWHDPSARHRCYHFADALAATSWKVLVVHIDRISKELVSQFDHVIFHRPKHTARFDRAFNICSQCDVVLHADYDDLIFDPELAEHSPLYVNGNRPIEKVREYFTANQRAILKFTSILVSTRSLADHVRTLLPQASVSVLPNSLPRLFQLPRQSLTSDTGFTVGYFPGSNSHRHDASMVVKALESLFSEVAGCRLMVVGKIEPSVFSSLKRSLVFKPFVDYNQYLMQLSRVNLSIAPLQKNVFNDSKSAVKLIESVAVGTPILASSNPDMTDHLNSMSVLVEEGSDWLSPLLLCATRKMGFSSQSVESLREKYSVSSRLPVLKNHLSIAA